jgi:hypothetical protein
MHFADAAMGHQLRHPSLDVAMIPLAGTAFRPGWIGPYDSGREPVFRDPARRQIADPEPRHVDFRGVRAEHA